MISTADLCTEKIRSAYDDYLFDTTPIGNGFKMFNDYAF